MEEAEETPPAPAPPPCVEQLPSFEAARALAESRYSCLVVTPQRRHVALPPRFLQRKRSGIRAQLDAELRRFSESFQGVPVAYDDIKITKGVGDIIDDIGAVHLDIEASFVVFQPKEGEKLVGMINKVAPSHIGCLVHGCFNASIPKPDHMSTDEWKDLGFQIGNRLIFKVLCFDSDAAGVFCIRGKLCRKRTVVPNHRAVDWPPPDQPPPGRYGPPEEQHGGCGHGPSPRAIGRLQQQQ